MSQRSKKTNAARVGTLVQTPTRIAKNSASLKGLTARNSPRCLKDGDFGRIKHLKAYRNTEKFEL